LFDSTTFQGYASFSRVTFQKAQFYQPTFQRQAGFQSMTVQGTALFSKATFQDHAVFSGATFQDVAAFEGATFQRDADFRKATFQDVAAFEGATVQRDADFSWATFQQARQLGPMLVRKRLRLDQAVFHEQTQVEVAAAVVCCQRTWFSGGVQLRVRWAQVVLDDANLAAPSILTGISTAFPNLDEDRLERVWRLVTGTHTGRPRLISVRRADVAGLTVAGMDLRACRFAGAHHLDQLRVEQSDFAYTPIGWQWTTRQTIAEEHHWRAAHLHRTGPDSELGAGKPRTVTGRADWYQSVHRPPAWLNVELPTPAQVAGLYRALRKGREDNKDEPGAADFYYGEMEMRRHDPTKPKAERLVLFCYWLLSGYALRASRSLAWLLGVLAVASVLLAAVGLEQPATAASWSFPARLGTAALVAVEGAVFRASEQELTYVGRLIQAALRFAGPILLGLAVLSVRGRVKR
jgi:uncharacterized protein YjbI with pentapeptide repeats